MDFSNSLPYISLNLWTILIPALRRNSTGWSVLDEVRWCNTAVSHILYHVLFWFYITYFVYSIPYISLILYRVFLWFHTLYFSESVDRMGWSVLDAVRWCKTAVGRLSTQLLISAVHHLQTTQTALSLRTTLSRTHWWQFLSYVCVKHVKNYPQNIARIATQCNHYNALQESESSMKIT